MVTELPLLQCRIALLIKLRTAEPDLRARVELALLPAPALPPRTTFFFFFLPSGLEELYGFHLSDCQLVFSAVSLTRYTCVPLGCTSKDSSSPPFHSSLLPSSIRNGAPAPLGVCPVSFMFSGTSSCTILRPERKKSPSETEVSAFAHTEAAMNVSIIRNFFINASTC